MHLVFEYDNPAFLKKPAWHNLGIVIPEGDVEKMKKDQVLFTASMDYEVEKLPVYRKAVGPTGRPVYFEVPDFFMTVRADLPYDNPLAYLGQVGEQYTTIQNAELRDFAIQLSNDEDLIFETAGTLRNGKLAWMLARKPETIKIKDDNQLDYLLISTSHDGTSAFDSSLTRIRVVCWNTLSAAIAGSHYKYKVNHTKGATWKIEEAKVALSQARKFSLDFTNAMRSFSNEAVSKRFVDAFLKALIPGADTKVNKAGKTVETPSAVRRDEVTTLIYGAQIGGKSDACWHNSQPTLYACFNAFTQWGETDRTVRCSTQANGEKRDHAEAKMDSVLFGSFVPQRQAAFELCAAQAGMPGYESMYDKIKAAMDE